MAVTDRYGESEQTANQQTCSYRIAMFPGTGLLDSPIFLLYLRDVELLTPDNLCSWSSTYSWPCSQCSQGPAQPSQTP